MGLAAAMRFGFAILAAVPVLPAPATAASGESATKTGSARAAVIVPVTVAHAPARQLNFGRFAVGTTAGTVIVSTGGSGSVTGGVGFVAGSANAADAFAARGDPGRAIAITTGTGVVSASRTSAMTFTTRPSLATTTIPASGTRNFTVGGTLSVGGGQAPGTYAGSYAVTVSYQ